MTFLLKMISYMGLALTLAPPLGVLMGWLDFEANKQYMLVGMLVWFGSSVFWINKDRSETDEG